MTPWKPASTGRRAPAGEGAPSPIAPTSIPSARSPASPWNCSTSSTSSGTPPATATPASAICYRQWLGRHRLSMRQEHRAGEKVFVDYAGQKPHLIDPTTGEVIEVELFVGVLGASNYTYAEATRTQQLPDWLGSHRADVRLLRRRPHGHRLGPAEDRRHRPVPVRTRAATHLRGVRGQHHGTTILPARPAAARDKAKVEVAVQIAERWILARLRHDRFFSLAALNARIAELRAELNARRMRRYEASRPGPLRAAGSARALRPLPATPFVYGEWKVARVSIDYHVEVAHHYYSVPHALVHAPVEVRLTALTVEIFHRGPAGGQPSAQRRPGAAHHRHRPHADGPPAAPGVESRLGSSPGPRASAPRPPSSPRRSWRPGRTRSRATDPVWGSSGSGGGMAPSGSRPPAPGRWRSAPARTAMSMRS